MKYLRLKNSQSGKHQRKNGTKNVVPILTEKDRKFGLVLGEEFLSRKNPLLITGAASSGKTRILSRLHEYALDVWGGHAKAGARLWLPAVEPLGAWCESEPAVAEWWDERVQSDGIAAVGCLPRNDRRWGKLRAWERARELPEFCKAQRAVVFLDDAHKLSGQKLDAARRCVLAARMVVVSATDENRIAPSLRHPLLKSRPQIIRLDSDVAYDATNIFVLLLVLGMLTAGAYELAAGMGALRFFLMRGAGGAKQQ